MASFVYDEAQKLFLSGAFNLADNNIKVMLLSGSYVPSQTTHSVTGNIGAHEVVDPLGSYVKGGKLLTSKTLSISNGVGIFDAADVSWTTATITASGAAVYQSGSTPATSYLIQYIDFGANQTSSNGTFQIIFNANGILNITEA